MRSFRFSPRAFKQLCIYAYSVIFDLVAKFPQGEFSKINNYIIKIFAISRLAISKHHIRGRHGRDRMVVGFTITAKVVSSNPVHCKVYSIQHFVIKFVSDL